jgi:AcrR family transcriptional regulator
MQTVARPGSPAEDTRSRILQAAKEIYQQNGTRGTTTREVAERAGVNEATLFRHFGNKNALLNAMRENSCGLAQFESAMTALTGDLREDMRLIGAAMAERMFAQRALMCVSLAEDARGDALVMEPEWRGPSQIIAMLKDFFGLAVARGAMKGDPARLATFFSGILFSYVIARKLWHSEVVKSDDIDFIVDVFLNGVQ